MFLLVMENTTEKTNVFVDDIMSSFDFNNYIKELGDVLKDDSNKTNVFLTNFYSSILKQSLFSTETFELNDEEKQLLVDITNIVEKTNELPDKSWTRLFGFARQQNQDTVIFGMLSILYGMKKPKSDENIHKCYEIERIDTISDDDSIDSIDKELSEEYKELYNKYS